MSIYVLLTLFIFFVLACIWASIKIVNKEDGIYSFLHPVPQVMKDVLEILKMNFYEILDRKYNKEVFGSWFIIAQKSNKTGRLLWDGKEGILEYQIKFKPEWTEEFKKEYEKWGDEILWKRIATDNISRAQTPNSRLIADKLMKLFEG